MTEHEAIVREKIEMMLKGQAVIMSGEQLNTAIELTPLEVRIAHNRNRVGVLDQWVCWISGRDGTLPPAASIDPKTLQCSAVAGRCLYTYGSQPVPDDYHADTH